MTPLFNAERAIGIVTVSSFLILSCSAEREGEPAAANQNTEHAQVVRDARSSIRNFFAYNECDRPVVAHVQYTPIGQNVAKRVDVKIRPGERKFVAAESANQGLPLPGSGSIVTSANSSDGHMMWPGCAVLSLVSEYTYAITCKCDASQSDCRLPKRWPSYTLREYPKRPGQDLGYCVEE